MPTKTSAAHCGMPTEASLEAFLEDPTQLLQCADCGAWVRMDGKDPESISLEAHVDRRPRVNRNRPYQIYRRRWGH